MGRWVAWLVGVTLVAGCGDDGGATDAGVDPDAVRPVVRLTVTRKDLPAVGARVVFQDAASNVVHDTVTAQDGSAAAELEAGGFVTVVEPKDPVGPNPPPTINDKLATFAAVAPGDELRLDLEPKPTAMVVTMSAPPTPDAVSFNVTSTCGNGSINQTDDVVIPAMITLSDCRGSADFALVAVDGIGTELRGMYSAATAIGDPPVVQLTGTWAPLVTSMVTPDPAPSWAEFMGIDLAVRTSRGTVIMRTQFLDPAAPVAQFTLPPTMGTTAAISVSLIPPSTGFSRQRLVRWGLPVVDPTMSTSSLVLAPYLTLPAWDAATRTVTWTEGSGAKADAVRVEVHTFRDGFPAHVWDWQLIAPRGAAARITYPVWPGGGDFDFAPKAGDSSGVSELETISVTGGYDAIRAVALRRRLDVPMGGTAGQLSYQQVHTSDN